MKSSSGANAGLEMLAARYILIRFSRPTRQAARQRGRWRPYRGRHPMNTPMPTAADWRAGVSPSVRSRCTRRLNLVGTGCTVVADVRLKADTTNDVRLKAGDYKMSSA